MFLVIPAQANDVWDDIKDAVEDDNRPGQHGRDNAERAQKITCAWRNTNSAMISKA
jgi:hypothetical protein